MFTQVQTLKQTAQDVVRGEIIKNSSNPDSMRQFCKALVEQMHTSSTYVEAVYTTLDSQELTTIDWAISTNQHFFIACLLQEIIDRGPAKQKEELQLGLETSFAKPGLKQSWSDFLSSPIANLLKQYCLATNNFKLAICFFPIDRVLCDDKQYPLHFFASRGMKAMVDGILSKRDAQLNATIVIDGQSFTAIDLAMRNKHYDIVYLLLNNGATLSLEQLAILPAKLEGVGSEELSPQASSSDSSGLEKGPQEELNPFITIIQSSNYPAITMILRNIIQTIIASKDPSAKQLIAYFQSNLAEAYSKLGLTENVVNFLKSLSAYQAKELSLITGYTELATCFFPIGAFVFSTPPTKEFELHYFASMGMKDKLQEALVSSKAGLNRLISVNEKDTGKTPLDIACLNEHFDTALMLLTMEAKATLKSKETMVRRILDLKLYDNFEELLNIFNSPTSLLEDLQLLFNVLSQQEKLPRYIAQYLSEQPNELWLKILPSTWQKDTSDLLGLIKNALESTNKTNEKQELYKLACSTVENYSQNIDSLVESIFPSRKSKPKKQKKPNTATRSQISQRAEPRAKVSENDTTSPQLPVDESPSSSDAIAFKQIQQEIKIYEEVSETPQTFNIQEATIVSAVKSIDSTMPASSAEPDTTSKIQPSSNPEINLERVTNAASFEPAYHSSQSTISAPDTASPDVEQTLETQTALAQHTPSKLQKSASNSNETFMSLLFKFLKTHSIDSLEKIEEQLKAPDSYVHEFAKSILSLELDELNKPMLINGQNRTALELACQHGCFHSAILLVEQGAEITDYCEQVWNQKMQYSIDKLFEKSNSWDKVLQKFDQTKQLEPSRIRYLSALTDSQWLEMLPKQFPHQNKLILQLIRHILEETNSAEKRVLLHRLACSRSYEYDENYRKLQESIRPKQVSNAPITKTSSAREQQSTTLDLSKPIVILRRPTKDSKTSASSLSSAPQIPQAASHNNLNFFRATNGSAKNHRQSQLPLYGRKTTPDSKASASSSSSMANTPQPASSFSVPEITTSSKMPVFHQSMASSLVQATLDYIENLESKSPDEVIQKLDVVIAARLDLRGLANKVKECISNAAQLHTDGKFKDLSYAIFNIRRFLMNLGPECYPNAYDDKLLGYQVENLNKYLATSSPISNPTP
ncbi:MAG: ankyrin repeat domain-containing protein [Proteobacteria bacterium]|nr:ankyrin repeat domain-containing protein [Pseudomonadota bacterium]